MRRIRRSNTGKGKARVATPSKYYGKGDVYERLAVGDINNQGNKKGTVEDICDFCLPEKITYIRLYRKYLSLRKYGYKFACSKCFFEAMETYGGSLKGKKILGDYRTFIKKKI